MTSAARRSVPLLLTGAVGSALALTACARAGPAAPTSPRPALAQAVAMIPGAARQVTLSMNYGANANGRKPPSPVTVTDSAKVGEVAWLVDHLPPWPPGTYNCPPGDGMALILAFRAPGRSAARDRGPGPERLRRHRRDRGRQGLRHGRTGLGSPVRRQGARGRQRALEAPAFLLATDLAAAWSRTQLAWQRCRPVLMRPPVIGTRRAAWSRAGG